MTDEIKAAEEKVQDVGKKLTGFLGGLAEKAKNIDVKDLTEKAKQKVGEVKDIASEIGSGKTDNFAQPREEISTEQMKELIQKMTAQMAEALPRVVEAELVDLAAGEQVVYKIKTGSAAEPSYAVLTNKSLLFFTKASEQFTAAVYPLSAVQSFAINPPRGETAGRFTILMKNAEIKMNLGSIETYCKALLFYRKLRETPAK